MVMKYVCVYLKLYCHLFGDSVVECDSHEYREEPSLTLLLSSPSSSLMELEGEGVADLLAGGEGEV